MKINCPYCHQEYELREEKYGKPFTCIECGRDFIAGEEVKKGKGLIITLICLLVLIAVLGGAGFFLLKHRSASAGQTEQKSQTEKSETAKTKSESTAGTEPAKEEAADPRLAVFRELSKIIQNGTAKELGQALQNADVNYCPEKELPLLLQAVRQKKTDMVQTLLSHGADINAVSGNDNAASIAARNDDLPMLEFLIRNNVIYDGSTADTPIGIAAENGFGEMVAFFTSGKYEFKEYGSGEKAIFRAVRNQHVECAKLLFPYANSVEDTDKQGNTLLAAAVDSGNSELVQFFRSKGADPCVLDGSGTPLFLLAILSGNPQIIAQFQTVPIDRSLTDRQGNTIPIMAAKKQNWDIMHEYLTEENKQQRNKDGCNVLFYACAGNAPEEEVLFLLKKGIDAENPAFAFSQSALYAAVTHGSTDAARALLSRGTAAWSATDSEGNDALMLASRQGNPEMVQLILDKMPKLSVFRKNRKNQTALTLAQAGKHTTVVPLLRQAMKRQMEQRLTALDTNKSISWEQKIRQAEAMRPQAGGFSEVVGLVDAHIKKYNAEIVLEQTQALNAAVNEAKELKDPELAVRKLKYALTEYPRAEAASVNRAKDRIEDLQLRIAEIKRKEERVAASRRRIDSMSQAELRAEASNFINDWLKDMQVGNDTRKYWKYPALGEVLFSVKSWTILDGSTWGAYSSSVKIIIESSTKGGSPIRKVWSVSLTRDEDDEMKPKVLSLTSVDD